MPETKNHGAVRTAKVAFNVEMFQSGGGIFLLYGEDKNSELKSRYAKEKTKRNPRLKSKYQILEREVLTPVQNAFHGMAREQLLLSEPEFLIIMKELRPDHYGFWLKRKKRLLALAKKKKRATG